MRTSSPVHRTAVLPLARRAGALRHLATSNTFQTVTKWRVSPTFARENVSVRRNCVYRGRRLGLHGGKRRSSRLQPLAVKSFEQAAVKEVKSLSRRGSVAVCLAGERLLRAK